jgi:hypothetical protein
VFTVGVGTAVAEGFVSEIAQASGGACELASPQEGMAEKILAQFHRLRQPGIQPIELAWDAAPLWQTALPETLFAGDTVNVFAGFGSQGPARLNYKGGAAGAVSAVQAELPDVPRLAAQARIDILDEEQQKLALALQYQLLTPQTTFLVVAERLAKAEDLPELVKVPQMLAAGMFEKAESRDFSQSAMSCCVDYCVGMGLLDIDSAPPAVVRRSPARRPAPAFDDLSDDLPFDGDSSIPESAGPDFSVRAEAALLRLPVDSTPQEFVFNLDRSLASFRQVAALPATIAELEHFGLPAGIAGALRGWVGPSVDEADIVLAFLHALTGSTVGGLGRGLLRLIMSARKRASGTPALDAWLAASLAGMDAGDWHWSTIPVHEEAGTP